MLPGSSWRWLWQETPIGRRNPKSLLLSGPRLSQIKMWVWSFDNKTLFRHVLRMGQNSMRALCMKPKPKFELAAFAFPQYAQRRHVDECHGVVTISRIAFVGPYPSAENCPTFGSRRESSLSLLGRGVERLQTAFATQSSWSRGLVFWGGASRPSLSEQPY